MGFPGGSDGKAPVRNMGDLGSIPALGRSPGEGNCTTIQYPCLENPMDGGAWWAIVHGVTKSQTQLRDITFTFIFHCTDTQHFVYLLVSWRIFKLFPLFGYECCCYEVLCRSFVWKSLSHVQLFVIPRTIRSINSPGQNTGVGSHSLLWWIFPTQGSNPGLLHCSRFFTSWTTIYVFNFLGFIPRSRIDGSLGKIKFDIWEDCQTIFKAAAPPRYEGSNFFTVSPVPVYFPFWLLNK